MNFGVSLVILFVGLWSIAMFSYSEALSQLLLVNAGVQVALFFFVACVPFLRTSRMSYVDIAWPFGVALIGAQIILFADGDFVRRCFVGGVYLFIGLRMGLGALFMAKTTGVIIRTEFPRYEYRRMLLEKTNNPHPKLHMLAEILAQGFANISVLAFPGFIIAMNQSPAYTGLELLGLGIWIIAYTIETMADGQKMLFISKNKEGVCNIGLWRYSRHPNYFAEWLVWTGLVLAAISSWSLMADTESVLVWAALGFGSLCASLMMYITLVYLTGAKPAEYYSVRKRAGYSQYQQTTSMFFPWFPKQAN
ncbi:MAG: DUF1295 domain-containing protein [Pseudomonadales bacterium]|nr:DUF1295 domain-containing protein [Pseudomonadales bacterium]